MATYIQLINKVLIKLREPEVAAPDTSDYSELIGAYVNETKREVEDAHKWSALRTQIQVTTAAGTSQYAVTGAGDRFKFTDARRPVYNTTENTFIHPRPSTYLKHKIDVTPDQNTPLFYYLEGKDASGDPYVNFWPIPAAVNTINFELVVPQDDLVTASTVLSVPEWPVVLGAFAKALAERGEDNGRTHGEALNNYMGALSDAIAIDNELNTGESCWSVD